MLRVLGGYVIIEYSGVGVLLGVECGVGGVGWVMESG